MAQSSPTVAAEPLGYHDCAVGMRGLLPLLRGEVAVPETHQAGTGDEVVSCVHNALIGVHGLKQIGVVRHYEGARALDAKRLTARAIARRMRMDVTFRMIGRDAAGGAFGESTASPR